MLKDNYSGSVCKLNSEQEKQLLEELKKKVYISAKEICVYVEETFGVSYTPQGIVHMLHRLGFVKQAKRVPGKADIEKQEKFIGIYYKLEDSLGVNDKIYFLDGMHSQHNSVPRYGWIFKGEDIEIKSNTGRERLNLNGAINIDRFEVIIRDEESINADAIIELLKEIERKNPEAEKIYTISDNARYYKAKIVQEFLKTSKVEMVFLPPYCPNLNLIERLWSFFQKEILYNKYYESFQIFKKKTFLFFEELHLYKDKLSTLMVDKFHIVGLCSSQT